MATVSPHVPVLVETLCGSNVTLYGLRMFGHVVIVQADGLPAYAQYQRPDDMGCVSHDTTFQDLLDSQKERLQDIEIIQTQLKVIKWQACPWMYLQRKGRRLIEPPRNRKMYSVAYPAWATLIEEEDIVLTKVIDLYHRQGIWKGTPVEFIRGWNDDYLRHIEQGMRAYRQLKRNDLDFSFEILGHVVNDGKIVGYVTEQMTGRMVEYCDRAIVYSAVARLHSAGLTYTSFCDTGLMVCDGQVKFLNLAGVRPVTDEHDMKLDWEQVEDLFAPDRRGVPNMWRAPKDAEDQFTVLTIVPDPDRLFESTYFSMTQILSVAFQKWQEKCHRDDVRRDRRTRRAAAREDWDVSTVCSSNGALSKAGSSRATSILSDAPSSVSTVARFHPYGAIMRNRIQIFNDGIETSTVISEGTRTLVASSRGVSLAPS
ncbi:hypothetical protein BD626DRAFT_636986 [Schizophyllum amplum]|uniref:Uncharacterized protein n=1 Tax=Schizophyllum amplum TaxID=97359 RepID=A0A550BSN9_9AGAR|nr:hypothetical protein BD626DRAFT_636986 [Auriculariopsis ampla]